MNLKWYKILMIALWGLSHILVYGQGTPPPPPDGAGSGDIYNQTGELIIWTGAISSDWFDLSNWNPAVIPSAYSRILIPEGVPNMPVISNNNSGSGTNPPPPPSGGGSGGGNNQSNNFQTDVIRHANSKLENSTSLTIENGVAFTFSETAQIETVGTAKIIVHASASYVNLSADNPYLETSFQLSGNKGWRLLSSPFDVSYNSFFSAPLVTQGYSGSTFPSLQPNLFWWDESEAGTTLQSWRMPGNGTSNILTGQGLIYFVFNGAGRPDSETEFYTDVLPISNTISGYEPQLFGSSYSWNGSNAPLTFTNRPTTQTPSPNDTIFLDILEADAGWNLIANPTASPLNWDSPSGWTKTNLDNTIYIWDPASNSSNGEYLFWNGTTGTLGDGIIRPFEAFWVHANNSNPLLEFNNNAKTSLITNTHFKETIATNQYDISLTLSGNEMQANIFLSLDENARLGTDVKDAFFLQPLSDDFLMFYMYPSHNQAIPLVINHLPLNSDESMIIPLFAGINAQNISNNTFLLNWNLPENMPSDYNIVLMDHHKQTAVSMIFEQQYSFEMDLQPQSKLSNASLILPAVSHPRFSRNPITNNDNASLKQTEELFPIPEESNRFSIVIEAGPAVKYPTYLNKIAILLNPYPNPCKQNVQIRWQVPENNSQIEISAFNQLGQKIATIAKGSFSAGNHTSSLQIPEKTKGLIYIQLISDNNISVKKLITLSP